MSGPFAFSLCGIVITSTPSVIRARVLHSAGIGESLIGERISDLEELANPTA